MAGTIVLQKGKEIAVKCIAMYVTLSQYLALQKASFAQRRSSVKIHSGASLFSDSEGPTEEEGSSPDCIFS